MHIEEMDEEFEAAVWKILDQSTQLGLGEARVAFISANDPEAKLFPLSECLAVSLRQSYQRRYDHGLALPVMLSANYGHWHADVAHWGGPQWVVSPQAGRLFQIGVDKIPADARPEGALLDLRERGFKQLRVNIRVPLHRVLINASLKMLDVGETRSGVLFPELVTPQLLALVPTGLTSSQKNWLILRQGSDLDTATEVMTNRIGYRIPVCRMDAPGNGLVTPTTDGGYIFKDADGLEETISNQSDALQEAIYQAFGATVPVHLHRMFDRPTKVARKQVLFTPIQEQVFGSKRRYNLDMLKRMNDWQLLQYMAVLASAFVPEVPDETRHLVDTDLAFTLEEPLVYLFPAYPRSQRVSNNAAALHGNGASFRIDLMDTPIRAALRRNRAIAAERTVAAEKKAQEARLSVVSAALPFAWETPKGLSELETLVLRIIAQQQVFRSIKDVWQRVMEKSPVSEQGFRDVVVNLTKLGLVKVQAEQGKMLHVMAQLAVPA